MSGAFDPITRQQVDPNVLIPNHMLKKAGEDFLARNPWAYQHVINEDYREIMMWPQLENDKGKFQKFPDLFLFAI